RLVKQYPGKLSLVQGNPDSLGQVWTNVLMNAIQAVEGKGTITIIVEELPKSILVKITDDGYGIPLEARDKIFEAFYTTKKRGYGTGLGLNISKRIVEQHGADISFESEPKRTVFIINLRKSRFANDHPY
ncbi:MAG: ATP-binding protein, partial [Cytophagales bacterium]|nr:ATP-binding protein [Cytophagales bacterium]